LTEEKETVAKPPSLIALPQCAVGRHKIKAFRRASLSISEPSNKLLSSNDEVTLSVPDPCILLPLIFGCQFLITYLYNNNSIYDKMVGGILVEVWLMFCFV